jgi:hypothetical protein
MHWIVGSGIIRIEHSKIQLLPIQNCIIFIHLAAHNNMHSFTNNFCGLDGFNHEKTVTAQTTSTPTSHIISWTESAEQEEANTNYIHTILSDNVMEAIELYSWFYWYEQSSYNVSILLYFLFRPRGQFPNSPRGIQGWMDGSRSPAIF